MTISDSLLHCMLAMGLSESRAMFHVESIAPLISRSLERERKQKVCRDMLPTLGAMETAKRAGVCRATVYNAVRRKSNS